MGLRGPAKMFEDRLSVRQETVAHACRRCGPSSCQGRRLLVEEAASDVSGTITFGDTKNSKARTVSLPAFVVESLARVMEEVPADPDALVFTSPTGKVLRYSNFRRNDWDPARERAGFPDVTPHALRHSCASIMCAMGPTRRRSNRSSGTRRSRSRSTSTRTCSRATWTTS